MVNDWNCNSSAIAQNTVVRPHSALCIMHSLRMHLAFVFQDSLVTVQNAVHKWGPAFIGLGKKLQMLEMTQASCNPMDWNVAHITICLAKNLHILGGDKNGSHHICLGWNLQNLGVGPNF